jgi:hypothetical protein
MNFNHVLAAISSAPRSSTLLLALLVTCVITAACVALYASVPLAFELLRAYLAKRARRKARVRARRAALRPKPSKVESVPPSVPRSPGGSRKAVGALVTCSVLVAVGAVTAVYVLTPQRSTVARAVDADWVKGPSRLRIDYELGSR